MTVKYPKGQAYDLKEEIDLQRELDLQKELDTFQELFDYLFDIEAIKLTLKFQNIDINLKRKIKKEITFGRAGKI